MLRGNLAADGCVVKTAGIDPTMLTFTGPAVVVESQEDAVDAILDGRITAGDVVVVRYEGPRGGPGMQEMLYPTSFLKGRGLGRACALVTDGRFSGGTSGPRRSATSHPRPPPVARSPWSRTATSITIDIPARTVTLLVDEQTLESRRTTLITTHGYRPLAERPRQVSTALRAYAALVTSADRGAVRQVP